MALYKILLLYFFLVLIILNPTFFKKKYSESIFYINQPLCPRNQFRFSKFDKCKKIIDCKQFYENVTLLTKIDSGVVKDIWLAKLESKYLIVSFLRHENYKSDFVHNIRMLKSFSSVNSKYVTEYFGKCGDNILFTKYYPFGSLNKLPLLLRKNSNHKQYKSKECFQYCIYYAKIIYQLHNSPFGIRVMCDSNDMQKLLSQFLITLDLKIVANDLDALPNAAHKKIRCGNRKPIGNLVAPEQYFINGSLPYYNEKIDIFKIPFVCNWFLSLCEEDLNLKKLLNEINQNCFKKNYEERPNIKKILEQYIFINNTNNFFK